MNDGLARDYLRRIEVLEKLRDTLESETIAALKGVPHIDRVTYRVKTVESFVAKATDGGIDPPYKDPLVEVEDQVGGRVIVFFRSDLQVVLECLKRNFNTIERSRYRPKRDAEFGYESDHIVCVIPPHLKPPGWESRNDLPTTFELQIRTLFMHAYAEPEHDLQYKAPRELPHDIRKELAWIAASSWGADQAYERILEWERTHHN
jgi:ppGpp synthetase/RelA/SpoT-type nucleotidyltranferase